MKDNNYVKWTVFVWVVAIFTVILSALWTVVISQMTTYSEMRSDVAVIRNDVNWIKLKLGEQPITYHK